MSDLKSMTKARDVYAKLYNDAMDMVTARDAQVEALEKERDEALERIAELERTYVYYP